jgi:hypothetical protein
MKKAIHGNPEIDRDVVQRFFQARDALRAAVTDILGNENIVRNLGLDTLDSIKTSLLESRLEADRGLIVLPKWHTVRSRQSLGGIAKRVGDLEKALEEALGEAVAAPDPDPTVELVEEEESPIVSVVGETDSLSAEDLGTE